MLTELMSDRSPGMDADHAGSEGDDDPSRDAEVPGLHTHLIEAVEEGIFAADVDGRIVYANEAMTDLLGCPVADLPERRLSAIFPELPEQYRDVFDGFAAADDRPGEESPIEVRIRDVDGTDHRVSMSLTTEECGGQTLRIGVLRDISERNERTQQLERYETIMEAVDDGIYILDSNFEILEVNEAVASMTGYSREELVGSHASLLGSEDILEDAAELSRELLRSDRDAASIRADIRTADGDSLPIETRFSLYPFDDGRYGQVGVIRDVTERKRFEETLTALNRSTRDLLGVTSEAEICRLVADTATEVLDLAAATVYLFDPADHVLSPVAVSNGEDGSDVDTPEIPPGEGMAWNAFVENRTIEVESSDRSDVVRPINRRLYLPLGDRGLFVAGITDDAVDEEMRTVLDLLVANTKAALDRAEGKAELREREQELAEQNRRLRRLDRLNEIIRDIDAAVVEADTFDAIGQDVCDRLIASEWFDFAWIGDRDLSTDEISPERWSGSARGYLDEVSLSLEEPAGEPTVRAMEGGELTHVSNVGDDLGAGDWRKAALSRGFRSIVSVPLQYGDLTYGVLSAYGSRPAATDEMIRTVLEELGETVANAMNAVEAKQSLLTDSGIELTLRFAGSKGVLSRLGRTFSNRVRIESVVSRTDGALRVYLTAPELSEERVRSFVEESVSVREMRTVAERESASVFEAEIVGDSVASTLVAQGAAIESVTVDGGGMTVAVDLPPDANVRSFVEGVKAKYPNVELIGRKRNEQPVQTRPGFRATVEERLSDRQQEIAQIAYHSGYFEWPRERTGVEIAESLDIAQPTFSRHLRVAERKLLALLFG